MIQDKRQGELLSCVGYFDEPGQMEPKHSPSKAGGSCPVCSGELKDTACSYRSIMPMGGNRSYFITYHKACDKARVDDLEDDIVGEIFAWDDARIAKGEQ